MADGSGVALRFRLPLRQNRKTQAQLSQLVLYLFHHFYVHFSLIYTNVTRTQFECHAGDGVGKVAWSPIS